MFKPFILIFIGFLIFVPVGEGTETLKVNIFDLIEDAQSKAASKYNIPLELMQLIKKVESGGHPWALCVNLSGGTSYSVYPRSYNEAVYYLSKIKTDNIDIGPWQVNYYHLGKSFGISKEHLLNPYYAAYIAAFKLSSEIAANGYTWNAVGNYNSRTLSKKIIYVRKLKKQLRKDGYKVD